MLAEDGRADLPTLAKATGWSESTARRRLDQLRRGGLLYFDVDVDRLGTLPGLRHVESAPVIRRTKRSTS